MDKKTIGIIAALVVVFAALVGISLMQQDSALAWIKEHDINQEIPASEYSGDFPEMIVGDPDAPVKLIEYGDYQCDACAPLNPHLNELLDEYDGKVAIIFRTMIMSYHSNGVAAASAALAAYNQGYWKEMKDLMYTNLDDWFYASAEQRQPIFEEYFMQVSDNKGDIEKFRQDMQSKEVSKKISFDQKVSELAKVEWTPYIMFKGELISQRDITRDQFIDNLREKIDAELDAQGIKVDKKEEKK